MCFLNSLLNEMEGSAGRITVFHKRNKLEVSFASLLPRVMQAASWLQEKGFGNQTILGIIGKNDLEWVLTDLACIGCGIKLLPLEKNSSLSAYLDGRINLSALLVGDQQDVDTYRALYPGLEIYTLAEVTETITGKPVLLYKYDIEEIFSYKSTSGSTGIPKVIGHSVEGVENSIAGTQALFGHSRNERVLVFLPLNLLQQRYWVYSAILYGFTVVVVPKEYAFMAIRQEQPTVIMGVPYIYELIHENFNVLMSRNPEMLCAYKAFLALKSEKPSRFQPFNDYLGGHINYLWTGSAPIAAELVAFYFKMGVPLYQGYGMNETCIIAKNYHEHNKCGSVGKLFPGMELKFDEQQQILVRSAFPVCTEYTIAGGTELHNTFLADGFVATGDIGHLDEEGYLFIDGRIREMIVLSNSKKIFPTRIEEKIKSQGIEQCVIYGDKKPYLVAMLVPTQHNFPGQAIAEIIKTYNESAVDDEKIIRWCVGPGSFTEDNSFLTNQNKIKRNLVYEKFHSDFEALYR